MVGKVEQKLSRIDLNLLVSLSVLLSERSVTKAANAMYVSQPAMSKTLQRLRDLFDDPLFHRTSSGIVPTAKAIELQKTLPKVINSVNELFNFEQFDPKTSNISIKISVPSVLCHSLILPFANKLNNIAPNICVSDYPSETVPFESLENGKYDFAFHITPPPNDNFTSTSIGYLSPKVYARKNHPLAKNKIENINELSNYKFVYYQVGLGESNGFENPADRVCRNANFTPEIVARSSHLSLLTELLANNDYLLIAPNVLLNSKDFSKKFIPVFSFDKHDRTELLLLESNRIKNNEAEQWIKEELIKSISLK